MRFFETHCHLDFSDFDPDREETIRSARDAGVERLIVIGTDLESSLRAINLAERYDFIYATAGIHPNNAHEAPEDWAEQLAPLLGHPRVVAVGECGSDYHYLPKAEDFPSPERHLQAVEERQSRQKDVFQKQLELAAGAGLNVVIHQRESWDDTLDILAPWSGKLKAVYHCFGGNTTQLGQVLELGFYVSFTGIVTFKKAPEAQASATAVPAGRYMLETDCPYLAPVPHRGKRCEPAYVPLIARKIAELRGEPVEKIADDTTRTALEFFRFPCR